MKFFFLLVAAMLLGTSGSAQAWLPPCTSLLREKVKSVFASRTPGRFAALKVAQIAGSHDEERWKRMVRSKDLDHVMAANQRWATNVREFDEHFFSRLADGQSPHIFWLGCTDANALANEIVGYGPGEIFVHRNLGNMLVNNDNSAQSALQFAVEYLEVDHIIVCGHYSCQGVGLSFKKQDMAAPLDEWVRNMRDVKRLHKDELSQIEDVCLKERRMVELNTMEQVINVHKTAVVQRHRIFSHLKQGFATPKVHAVVFDPATGELHKCSWESSPQLVTELAHFDLADWDEEKSQWALSTEQYPVRPNTIRHESMFNRLPTGLAKPSRPPDPNAVVEPPPHRGPRKGRTGDRFKGGAKGENWS